MMSGQPSGLAPPPLPPRVSIKPMAERAPVSFTPAIRHAAHILYAQESAVPVSVIALAVGLKPQSITSVMSMVRTAIGHTGATITVETVAGERAYRLFVPNRHAFERLIGPRPEGVEGGSEPFHGFVGHKATVLRMLAEAGAGYVAIGPLMQAVYGRETTRAREKLVNVVNEIRACLRGRGDPGVVVSQGSGLSLAYAWLPDPQQGSAVIAPVQRVEGVTLPPIGCEAWRFYPATGPRHLGAHVVRLRGEDRDRVLTDGDTAMKPELSALAAPHGVWPPARDEEREAA